MKKIFYAFAASSHDGDTRLELDAGVVNGLQPIIDKLIARAFWSLGFDKTDPTPELKARADAITTVGEALNLLEYCEHARYIISDLNHIEGLEDELDDVVVVQAAQKALELDLIYQDDQSWLWEYDLQLFGETGEKIAL
jgi:hypothetical protein